VGDRRLLSLLVALLLLWTASGVFACTLSCAPRQYCPCCQPTKHSQPSARAALSLEKFLTSSIADQINWSLQEAVGKVRFPQIQIRCESNICYLGRDEAPTLRGADHPRPPDSHLAFAASGVLVHLSLGHYFHATAENSVRVSTPLSVGLRI